MTSNTASSCPQQIPIRKGTILEGFDPLHVKRLLRNGPNPIGETMHLIGSELYQVMKDTPSSRETTAGIDSSALITCFRCFGGKASVRRRKYCPRGLSLCNSTLVQKVETFTSLLQFTLIVGRKFEAHL